MSSAVAKVIGSSAAAIYRLTVRQSKIIIMRLRLKRSASFPPRIAAGRDSTVAVAISIVACPSVRPSFAVKKKVSMGHTKEPIAVTSLPMNSMYISFFSPLY